MTVSTYFVSGMTCGHCVNAVRTEVGKLPGVANVEIDLEKGAVTITSDDPVPADDLRVAVEEAGYQLVS